jgi:hypothetical protein
MISKYYQKCFFFYIMTNEAARSTKSPPPPRLHFLARREARQIDNMSGLNLINPEASPSS